MSRDPVCNMEIDEESAEFTSEFGGEQYVFCSQECKDTFDRNPQQFVKAA